MILFLDVDITSKLNATELVEDLLGSNCGLSAICTNFCDMFRSYIMTLVDGNFDEIIDFKEAEHKPQTSFPSTE